MNAPKQTLVVTSTLDPRYGISTYFRGTEIRMDSFESAFGDRPVPNPLEMVLISLGSSFCAAAQALGSRHNVPLWGLQVDVCGQYDPESLAQTTSSTHPSFHAITLKISLDSDLALEQQAEFIREIWRHCPLSDNLSDSTPFTVSVAA